MGAGVLELNQAVIDQHRCRPESDKTACALGFSGKGRADHRDAAYFAAFALSRSRVLPLSTTKRLWVPAPIGSRLSLAAISRVILRPSTALTVAVISTVIPGSVGARWLIDTLMPTESSLGSQCSSNRSRQVCSMSCTRPGSYTHLRAHETDSYLVCRL